MTKKTTYILIALTLALTSCKDENLLPDNGGTAENNAITFSAILPGADNTRGNEIVSKLDSIQVTAFYLEESATTPYFDNEKFRLRNTGRFTPVRVINCLWPDDGAGKTVEFYAFHPQLDNFGASGKYNINNIRIPADISQHFDFMTAKGKATIPDVKSFTDNNLIPPVKLKFGHLLSRINIQATAGSNKDYKFEIAGIRIGKPVVEGKYVFSDPSDESTAGQWDLSEKKQECVEYIFKTGDTIIDLGTKETSIMGNGKNAMLIPAKIAAWDRPAVIPENLDYSYATDKMYFSVLLRAKMPDGAVVYPYQNEARHPGMKKVYLAVDQENKIIAEVDKEYMAKEGETVKEFGWAAVPVGVDWEPGQSYRYTLDYSNGIGYHDPDDPQPGKFILEDYAVKISVTVNPWKEATAEFDSIVTVPYE